MKSSEEGLDRREEGRKKRKEMEEKSSYHWSGGDKTGKVLQTVSGLGQKGEEKGEEKRREEKGGREGRRKMQRRGKQKDRRDV